MLLALLCVVGIFALSCVVPIPQARMTGRQRKATLFVLLALAPLAAAHAVFAGVSLFSRL